MLSLVTVTLVAAFLLLWGGDASALPLDWSHFLAGGLIVNRASLAAMTTGFKTAFNGAFTGVQPAWSKVAMEVPSQTAQEQYAWLGQIPRIREWVGERVYQGIGSYDFTIKNKDYEGTLTVKRSQIEDDQYGVYMPIASELGRSAAQFPDELVFPLLNAGFTSLCYDGQYFFDVDHPVLDAGGGTLSISNTHGGAGTPWFLLDVSRVVKPLIYQKRKAFQFVSKMDADDEHVFRRNEYVWGVDGRCNAGYGLWQLAFGSREPLTVASYFDARAKMLGMRGDYGRPLGLMPGLLVVPPALEQAGLEVLKRERDANGATNTAMGTAELLVSPWLS